MNELGEYIKKIRNEKSLSIRKASEGIGISHTYLDSLEKGYDPRTKKERKPTYSVLKKIADFYNIDIIELLARTDDFTELEEVMGNVKSILDVNKGKWTKADKKEMKRMIENQEKALKTRVYDINEIFSSENFILKHNDKYLTNQEKKNLLELIELYLKINSTDKESKEVIISTLKTILKIGD